MKHLFAGRPSIRLSLLALLIMSACSPKPLAVLSPLSFAVQTEIPQLAGAAAELSGLTIKQDVSTVYWLQRFRDDMAKKQLLDIYLAEWGQELTALRTQGALADGKEYWRRSVMANRAPTWLKHLETGPAQGFLPSAVYTWGLFINKQLAPNYLTTEPATLGALEAIFGAAKSDGLTPIALGAAYGWPGAAWFTILDLRLNGAKAVTERYSGKRPFNDAGAKKVFQKLADWRDKGWFSVDASTTTMNDSLRAVETENAFCVLQGAFAYERFGNTDAVKFVPVPYAEGNRHRAEIAGLTGYIVPAGTSPEKTETAFALIDNLWLTGSPDQAANSYKVPLLAVMGSTGKLKTSSSLAINDFKLAQATILSRAVDIVLAFDRAMPAQALQDSIPLWAAFFGPNGGDGASFADKFQAAVGKSLQ